MAIALVGRTITVVPHDGQLNTRDPDGDGVFDPNDPGQVYVNNSSIQVDEDAGTASIPIVRSGGSGIAEVDYATSDGTGEAGTHYTSTSGTLQWVDGETGIKNVSVPVVDFPSSTQGDLTFTLTLSNPLNATIREDESGTPEDTTTVTIRDLNGATAEQPTVLWNGDFSTGDLLQYHIPGDTTQPNLWGWPAYGQPVEWGGDGSLGGLVPNDRGPSAWRCKFINKNSVNGVEPDDCDTNGDCNQRRTEIRSYNMLKDYEVLKQFQSYWISVSCFIPSDWWGLQAPTDGFMAVFGIKPEGVPANSMLNVTLNGPGNTWNFSHRWSNTSTNLDEWQYRMNYDSNYPVLGQSPLWDDGVDDFPDPQTSYDAFASVNVGGWTDWVYHVNFDWRGAGDGGQGFFDLYKREDNGPWVHVLAIRPRIITRGGITWDRGIAMNDSLFWITGVGMYCRKARVWGAPTNQSMDLTNVRVYEDGTTLDAIAEMLG